MTSPRAPTDQSGSIERINLQTLVPPFHKAVQEWMAEQKIKNIGQLLINPRGCGLGGQIAFDKSMMQSLLLDQYHDFWNHFSSQMPSASAAIGEHREYFHYYFSEAAYFSLSALLMTAIMNGTIPHPRGTAADPARAGLPGSIEDDCNRAIGGELHALSKFLVSTLTDHASGNLTHDKALNHSMCAYLGLEPEDEAFLEARILHHYGVPNTYLANSHYGAFLFSALGRVCGDDTSEFALGIIEGQVEKHQWPQAYKELPLLDAVLERALNFYDVRLRKRMDNDQATRRPPSPDRQAEQEDSYRQASIITSALYAFKDKCLGTTTITTECERTAERTALCIEAEKID